MNSNILDHEKMMLNLKYKHQKILDLIDGNPVEFLDIPVYENIGDILIYLGTLELLRKAGINIISTSSMHNYSKKNKKSVILLSGGGNFGDLYPQHQKFRESIVSENKDKRIVILPQTIFFKNKENFEKSRAAISQHTDLHFLVRDDRSLEIASQMTQNVSLMPDMAHQLYNAIPHTQEWHSEAELLLLRSDIESPKTRPSLDSQMPVCDWSDVVGEKRLRAIRSLRKRISLLSKLGLVRWLEPALARYWENLAREIVLDAINLLAKHELIVTDRLHGHILSMLMNLKNEVIDNSYGKNFSYIESWTKNSSLLKLKKQSLRW